MSDTQPPKAASKAKATKTDQLIQQVAELSNEVQALSDDLAVVRGTLAQYLAMTNQPPTNHCPRCGRALTRIDGRCPLGCPA